MANAVVARFLEGGRAIGRALASSAWRWVHPSAAPVADFPFLLLRHVGAINGNL